MALLRRCSTDLRISELIAPLEPRMTVVTCDGSCVGLVPVKTMLLCVLPDDPCEVFVIDL